MSHNAACEPRYTKLCLHDEETVTCNRWPIERYSGVYVETRTCDASPEGALSTPSALAPAAARRTGTGDRHHQCVSASVSIFVSLLPGSGCDARLIYRRTVVASVAAKPSEVIEVIQHLLSFPAHGERRVE